MSFQIKIATLSHIKRKEEQDEKSNLKIKEEHDFFEKLVQFKEELKEVQKHFSIYLFQRFS